MPMPKTEEAACRIKNGWAALGCQIAYASPVRVSLDGLVLKVQGGQLKLSRLKRINVHSAYEMPTYYSLDLDDGANVDADDAVRVGD
jgi:hypothetical protein